MKLAHDMCRPESLPKSWTVRFIAEENRREYTNDATGETRSEHPLIGYYKGAIFMEQGGYEHLVDRDTKQPPSVEDVLPAIGKKVSSRAFV